MNVWQRCWQAECLPGTLFSGDCSLVYFLCTHTAYRGHCRRIHTSTIQRNFCSVDAPMYTRGHTCTPTYARTHTHTHRLKCQYMMLCCQPSSPTACLSFAAFSKTKERVYMNRWRTLSIISQNTTASVFQMICLLMHVEGGVGVIQRPPGHQSPQSSLQRQVEGLWHFWLAWLMCFWSTRGSWCQTNFPTQSQ